MFPLSISKSVSKFHRAKKSFMRKRSKLKKIYPLSPSIQSKLASIERDLISSHQKEESLAVAKIKSDPNYFSRYAKKMCVC